MITEMYIFGELNESERILISRWIKEKFEPCVVLAWAVADEI